jgi:AraC-like DNA-binding protein
MNLLVQLQRSESQVSHCDADADPVSCRLEIIERQLDGGLSVEYLADTLAVSPEYLSSLFSRTVGSNLSDYVWERRIAMARHFSRRFSQATGSTPPLIPSTASQLMAPGTHLLRHRLAIHCMKTCRQRSRHTGG